MRRRRWRVGRGRRDRLTPTRLAGDGQQRELARWVRGQRVEHRLRVRATIVWQVVVDGQTVGAAAHSIGVSTKTVRKWRDRYLALGTEGLHDRRRSGAPGRFTVGQRCELLAIACDDPTTYGGPDGPWTLDGLTAAAAAHIDAPAMSRSSVHRTLSEIVLRPHKVQMWLHSKDPLFKEKVNDVVGLYLEPPPGAVVLSIDEKTSIQALERPHKTKPALPGRPGRYEFEYVRHGTTSLMAAFNVQSGEVVHALGPTRTGDDLVAFMDEVATRYDDAERIIVIWDNLNTHLDGKSQRWAGFNARHGNRFEFHHTPIHASWLNQVEVFFSILQKVCLRWRSCRSVAELEAAINAFIARWNDVDGHPFHWTFRGYPLQSEAA